jgi:SAM-dependent methyltransferase
MSSSLSTPRVADRPAGAPPLLRSLANGARLVMLVMLLAVAWSAIQVGLFHDNLINPGGWALVQQFFAAAFRVLRPGGRLAVADIVARCELPGSVTANVGLWTACVAGALLDRDYIRLLQDAGFRNVTLQSIREYTPEEVHAFLAAPECVLDEEVAVASSIYSAFVRAEKPAL